VWFPAQFAELRRICLSQCGGEAAFCASLSRCHRQAPPTPTSTRTHSTTWSQAQRSFSNVRSPLTEGNSTAVALRVQRTHIANQAAALPLSINTTYQYITVVFPQWVNKMAA
jgi:predicted secreted protein